MIDTIVAYIKEQDRFNKEMNNRIVKISKALNKFTRVQVGINKNFLKRIKKLEEEAK